MGDGKLILLLFFIIALHFFVVIGNLITFFIIPFLQPWYIALPICSLIVTLSFGRPGDCPLTRFENKIRKELGLSQIKGFIKHYFFEIWR